MDKFGRLTKNSEWKVGKVYRQMSKKGVLFGHEYLLTSEPERGSIILDDLDVNCREDEFYGRFRLLQVRWRNKYVELDVDGGPIQSVRDELLRKKVVKQLVETNRVARHELLQLCGMQLLAING